MSGDIETSHEATRGRACPVCGDRATAQFQIGGIWYRACGACEKVHEERTPRDQP